MLSTWIGYGRVIGFVIFTEVDNPVVYNYKTLYSLYTT